MTTDEILPKLKNLKRTANGWTALCPAHNDQKRSLSVAEKDDKVLVHCFAGCGFAEIMGALDILTDGNDHYSGQLIAEIYDYMDENGKLLFQTIRFEPKGFGCRHFDKNGRAVWNLNGVRRVPYHLPEICKLSELQDFVMAEGEKDADAITKLGYPATNHKNWMKDFNYLLKGKQVLIFQDHDRAGVEQAEKVARMVFRDAKAVKIIDCFADEPLPIKHGRDVSDFLKLHSIEELRRLIDKAPLYDPNRTAENIESEKGMKVVCLADVEEKDVNWLWQPFIAIGEFTILEGIEGIGKSWIGCALACAVADGRTLPFSGDERLAPSNVLMLSAEDSLSHTVKPRLLSMDAEVNRIFAIDGAFSLTDEKDFLRFESIIAEYQPKLVIFDPIFSYTGGKNLNQESESRPIAQKLIAAAQKFDCAIVGVRHLGKAKGNGDARAAGLGSISWRASARSVLLVGRDEETRETAICQTKSNLAPTADFAVGFEIRNGEFFWKAEPSRLTSEKMLAQPKDQETKAEQTEAVEFLRELLKDGEKTAKDIEKEAQESGITKNALRRAKNALGIKSRKKGGNFGGEKGWFWFLPTSEESEKYTEDVDFNKARHLQANQSDKTSYANGLTEDVEKQKNVHLQQVQTASSGGAARPWRPKEKCKCGIEGYLGENCPGCNEILFNF